MRVVGCLDGRVKARLRFFLIAIFGRGKAKDIHKCYTVCSSDWKTAGKITQEIVLLLRMPELRTVTK